MSTTDKLLALLPSKWYSDEARAPGGVLYALLSSLAVGLDYISDACAYVRLQTRISTATDQNLDKISADFFGTKFPRRSGEADDFYRARIKKEIFRERATRRGVVEAVEDLGAEVLEVFEPFKDGFFADYSMSDLNRTNDLDPYNAILFVSRPLNPSRTNLFFSDFNYSDYNYMVEDAYNVWAITDDDIYQVVQDNKTYGTNVFVVLDPIPIGDTQGNNYSSITRYYVPPITKVGPSAAKFDDVDEFDVGPGVFG